MRDSTRKIVAKQYSNVCCIPHKKILAFTQKGGLLHKVRSDTLDITESGKAITPGTRYFFGETPTLKCLIQVKNGSHTHEMCVIAYLRHGGQRP